MFAFFKNFGRKPRTTRKRHRCAKCGGATYRSRWRNGVTGKRLYICRGCGFSFLGH